MTCAPPAWRLQLHDTLPSTADLCRRLAESGEPAGLAILARRQTAGRGTQGRSWIAPPGNLSLSVLLRPDAGLSLAPRYALLAAVAVRESLAPLTGPAARLGLKWPNDVLLDGGKIAGILTEAAAGPDGRIAWLALGIGVNLATAPSLPDRATACVGPGAPDPAVFAAALLDRLAAWHGRDFAAVREAWLRAGPAPGAPMQVRLGAAESAGAFAGLDEAGRLLLRIGDAVRVFAAGET